MKKAASKRTTTGKKKVGSLPARSPRKGNVKGGGMLTSSVSDVMKNFGGALNTAARKG